MGIQIVPFKQILLLTYLVLLWLVMEGMGVRRGERGW